MIAFSPLAIHWYTIQYYLEAGPDHLTNYLLLSGILLVLGVFILVTRRNAVAMLMGVEFILNAAALNFVAFSRFPLQFGDEPKPVMPVDGQVFTLFIIILAAAEAAVALALILAVFQTHDTIDLDKVDELSS
jgi:NADH:ubiquinone oxidoreductase subunit K